MNFKRELLPFSQSGHLVVNLGNIRHSTINNGPHDYGSFLSSDTKFLDDDVDVGIAYPATSTTTDRYGLPKPCPACEGQRVAHHFGPGCRKADPEKEKARAVVEANNWDSRFARTTCPTL